MDDNPSLLKLSAGVRSHQTSHDLDIIKCEDQPSEVEPLAGSPRSSHFPSGNAQPSDSPRAHVHRLGREYGLAVPKILTASVSNAVEIIINQLYDSSTHFILEFLQNLDDAQYENGVDASVKMILHGGFLHIRSNQIGFSEDDVEAICAVGSSTKKNETSTNSSIGEKGIGFKSVFRVADLVWLSSRGYHLKWDRNRKFGVFAPEWWDDWPDPAYPQGNGQTSFCMRIPQMQDREQVHVDLKKFDSALLLCLNKLRHVELEVVEADDTIWNRVIRRRDEGNEGASVTTLEDGERTSCYLKTVHYAKVPQDPKRPGCSRTKLILAFPALDHLNMSSPAASQNVYSGLPICSYGLKFILQADFLLTASRQSIDVSLPWNLAIRDSLCEAVLEATVKLNNSAWRFTWPFFVASSATPGFFEPAMSRVQEILRDTPSLETVSGAVKAPREVFYVSPEKFSDSTGWPFTLSQRTADTYVSGKYPHWVAGFILALDTRKMASEDFLEHLKALIREEFDEFSLQPLQWHVELANALLPLLDEPGLFNQVSKLCIVPLSDGKWVSADAKPLLYPEDIDLGSFDILRIESVKFVDPAVEAQAGRLELFRRLGIRKADSTQLCEIIQELHCTSTMRPSFSTRSQLLSHAWFLYQSSWAPAEGQSLDLWFGAADGTFAKGSSLYGSCTGGSPAMLRVTEKLRKKFKVLHQDYYVMDDGHETTTDEETDDSDAEENEAQHHVQPEPSGFIAYLVKHYQLAIIPRLVTSEEFDQNEFRLSDDFKYLAAVCSFSDLVEVLNDNWQHYAAWIEPGRSTRRNSRWQTSRVRLLQALRDTRIEVSDGRRLRLADTFLPCLDPLLDDTETFLPVLDVCDAEDKPVRDRLAYFGITVKKDLQFYISTLKSIRSNGNTPNTRTLAYVYEQIRGYYDSNPHTIESAFNENKLIFFKGNSGKLGAEHAGVWLSLTECFRKNLDLDELYPRSQALFRSLLDMGGLDLDALIKQASFITTSHSLAVIHRILAKTSKAVTAMTEHAASMALKPLRCAPIFPVTWDTRQPQFELRSAEDERWFVADRAHLRASFAGKVSLLALQPHDLDDLGGLLAALDLKPRQLSSCVTTTTYPKGLTKLRTVDTLLLNQRTPFFASLIPRCNPERDAIVAAIRTATVSDAADVVEDHTLKYGKSPEVKGRPSKGSFAASQERDGLKLFVPQDSLFSKYPLFQLVEYFAEYCSIKNPQHIQLLYSCLSTSKDILVTFNKLGLHVDIPSQNLSENNSGMVYWNYNGDSLTFPSKTAHSSSTESDNGESDSDGGNPLFGARLRRINLRNKGQRAKAVRGRRLPMRIPHADDDFFGNELKMPDHASWDMDPDQNVEYLGQVLVSDFLEHQLGFDYHPFKHWTSELRCRAGLPLPGSDYGRPAFTFADSKSSAKMTYFLEKELNVEDLQMRFGPSPVYHIDVVATVGGAEDNFQWTTSKLSRALQYRLRDQVTETKTKSKDVMILIKVIDVFYKPQMSVIIDPWEYLDKGQLKLQGGWKFTASLDCNSVPQIALSEKISPVVPGTGDADIFSPLTGNVADNTRRQPNIHGENRETSRSTFHSEFGDLPGIGGMPATGESRSQGIHTTANEVYDTPPIIITGHGNPDMVSSAPSPAHYSSDGRIASLKRVHPRMILHNVRSRFFPAGPSRHSPITSTYIESGSGPDSDQIPAGASDSTNTIAFATASTGARSSPGPPDQTGREMSHLWFATRLEPVSAAKTYQHERLDGKQMRLLTLFPGEEFEPLNGLIWVTRLDAKPLAHYMTVSYVWGTKSRLSNALRTPVGSISITEPLYLTLKKLRKRQKSIVLWVDAICINQNDDDEKTEQVRMLAQIFQNSAQTLGVVRGDEQSNKVIEMLMQVRAREVVSDESRAWPRNLPFCPKSWNERGLPPPLDPIWLKTVEFFRNDWFRRVWIIQEVVIARNIKLVCGKYTLDWEDLYSATQKIDQDPEMRVQADEVRQSWQPFLRLGDLRHLEASSNRLSTLVLLETFRHCQSTKRRDRFFSLLGIAADGDLEDFELDYKSPFEKVARRFGNALFRKYSERKQGMLLLYRAGLDEDKPDSPSWMPDWTREKQRSLLASANRGALFRAAWGSEESLKLYPKVGELTTDAYFVDTIKIVTQSCLDPGKRRQCRFFLEVEKIIENTYDRMDEADRAELLWRVPIAGAKYPKVAISGDHSLFNSWEAYWKLLKLDWSGNDKNATSGHVSREGKPSNLAEKSKAYASLLKDEVGGWRFVTTKHHLLCGMAPPNAREGDAVYIFCGGDVPFITRPSKDRPGTQRLVGQGYFHGIMEGEALDSGHIEKEELKLH